jgi:hypothetical protein
MNLPELQEEIKSRGFDFETTPRLTYWLNRAYHRICESDDWIWLRTTTTGTAPITISDLRSVLSVVDTTHDSILIGMDERTLVEREGDLTNTGTCDSFYRTGDTTLAVFPADTTSSLKVTYIKVPTDLSATNQTPAIPTRYHYLLVDGAVLEAYKDTDNLDAAGALEQSFQAGIRDMQTTYSYNHHGPEYQVSLVTGLLAGPRTTHRVD